MEMEGEIGNFIKVWLSVFLSLFYCYAFGKFVPKGFPRLLLIIPVVALFLDLPLHLSTIHLGGTTAFFISWLANFKLLLFAFGKGPLCSDPSISLPRFVAVACLPIKIQQNPPPKTPQFQTSNHQNGHNSNTYGHATTKQNPAPKSPLNYALKGLLLALLIKVYDYKEHLHPNLIWVMYCFHIYFALEIILLMAAALARALLGLELEPQFNEPYLSSSLQDFWGRRWNIMVTTILRPTVYEPVVALSTRVVGRRWAPLPAVMGTFIVSAIMHELIFYYLGRLPPTWEISWFFLLHGLCLVVEIAVKKAIAKRKKFQVPRLVSGPLTVAFVTGTVFWLFFPPLLRCNADVRALGEYAAVGAFFKNVGRAFASRAMNTRRSNW
ncbi:PREDICTED: acyl-CoA--sterol O-acyltransferase [Prunus dulcis]|uniref:PREDICTED: acyl-CoA--sterol O-acyltransferase n=2 Tax=Prunus dulcis TaxID=3755 RepID=A0A5E4FTB4_PRUDU|nr:acyl-CoA--sterol O-acyltransferase 1-like [Prunus dulcis]VVA30703.1 PREDICTED: acyl-CoA--sterol O-acyltransferase [Prunus dulcis]